MAIQEMTVFSYLRNFVSNVCHFLH